jgi:hypothetical protein
VIASPAFTVDEAEAARPSVGARTVVDALAPLSPWLGSSTRAAFVPLTLAVLVRVDPSAAWHGIV